MMMNISASIPGIKSRQTSDKHKQIQSGAIHLKSLNGSYSTVNVFVYAILERYTNDNRYIYIYKRYTIYVRFLYTIRDGLWLNRMPNTIFFFYVYMPNYRDFFNEPYSVVICLNSPVR